MGAMIKTAAEIAKMRVAGRLAAEALEMIGPHVVAGVSTGELDRICHDYIVNTQQAIPRATELQWFSEVDMYLGEPGGVPRYSLR